MAKKIVSFAIEPEEAERIAAVIKQRKESGHGHDRELNFSRWMRDAVLEKLAAEELSAKEQVSLLKVAEDPPFPEAARRRRAKGK